MGCQLWPAGHPYGLTGGGSWTREVCSRLLNAPCQNDPPSGRPKPGAQREHIFQTWQLSATAIETPCICPDWTCSRSCQLLEISQDRCPLRTCKLIFSFWDVLLGELSCGRVDLWQFGLVSTLSVHSVLSPNQTTFTWSWTPGVTVACPSPLKETIIVPTSGFFQKMWLNLECGIAVSLTT